jgi:autotransporter-associated beta strand protein
MKHFCGRIWQTVCASAGLVAALFAASQSQVLAYQVTDVPAIINGYSNAFYYVSGTNGYFRTQQNNSSTTYFWQFANEIQSVEDAYLWTSNSAYLGMTTNLLNGFLTYAGPDWSYDGYNDDDLWATMAFAMGAQITGRTNYAAIAKANFDLVYARAWDTNLGGGLYWEYPNNASKNACVNGPGAISAALLFQLYGDTNYWNKATNIYYWERAVLYTSSSGRIADNIGTNGTVNGGPTTYNQGTFIGAADLLGQTNDAALTGTYTMNSMSAAGCLPQYGIGGNNSIFNSIFIRWMGRFMRDSGLQAPYQAWLQNQANAAWNGRRTVDGLSWCQWPQQTPNGTNFYSYDCISSFEAMLAVPPTQTNVTTVVTLSQSDAVNTSSFQGGLNWSDANAPAIAHDYLVNGLTLRTPADGVNHFFIGNSLTLSNAAVLACKNTTGGVGVSIGTDLFLDNGKIADWSGNSTTFYGHVTLRSGGGELDPQGNTFTITALIGGAGSLHIEATSLSLTGGTLVFSGLNSYTGGTIVDAAQTVKLSDEGTMGDPSGSLTFSNSLGYGYGSVNLNDKNLAIGNLGGAGGNIYDNGTNGSTLTISNANGVVGTYLGVFNSNLNLVKSGAGTLALGGNNSYSGGTTINGGIVNAQNNDALGTSGTVTMLTRNAGIQLQGGITIPGGVNFTLSNDGTVSPVTYALDNVGGNNTLNGTISVGTGGGGTAIQSDSGALTLAGSISIKSGSTSRGIYLQGASTGSNTVSGVLSDLSGSSTFNVIKLGTGTWMLTGANTYSGGTTVSNGTLLVNNMSGSGTGSGAVLVTGTNAVLGGSGIIGSATVISGGAILAPRPANGNATTLTIGGNLLLTNASANFTLSGAAGGSNDKIAGVAQLNVGSGVTFKITGTGGLDQSTDYTLIASSSLGATNGIPSLIVNGVTSDQETGGNYKLLVTGSGVKLHYLMPVATNATNLVVVINGGNLILFWPPDHLGWHLQAQTNSSGKGLGSVWVDVPGTATVNGFTNLINPNNGATFYRLTYP